MSTSNYVQNGAGLAYSSQSLLRLSPDRPPPRHGEMVEDGESLELLSPRPDVLIVDWRVNGALLGISCGPGLELELVGDLNDILEISCELDMELVGGLKGTCMLDMVLDLEGTYKLDMELVLDLEGTCMLDMELVGDLKESCILAEISYELDMVLVVE